jgi:hypothetical protein
LQFILQPLDLLALTADNDTGPSRKHDDLNFVTSPLDLNLWDPGVAIFIFNKFPEFHVFNKKIRKLLLRCVPAALPAHHDTGAKANWINFLSHAKPSVTDK